MSSILDALLLEEPTPLKTPTTGLIYIALRNDDAVGTGTISDPYNGGIFRGPVLSSAIALGRPVHVTVLWDTEKSPNILVRNSPSGIDLKCRVDDWFTISGDTTGQYNGTFSIGTVSSPNSFEFSNDPSSQPNGALLCNFHDEIAITALGHDFKIGDVVEIAGVEGNSAESYNRPLVVLQVDGPTFRCRIRSARFAPAGAQITCHKLFYGFDAVMRSAQDFTAVQIGSGTFETRGFSHLIELGHGWTNRKGQKIVGSTMGQTILRLVHAPDLSGARAMGHGKFTGQPGSVSQPTVDGFEASNVSVDCNFRTQAGDRLIKAAVAASGFHTRIRRVRAFDFGTQLEGGECFVLTGGGGLPLGEGSIDCRQEDCVIEEPNTQGVYTRTTLGFGSGEDDAAGIQSYARACAVRNCYVNGEFSNNPVGIQSAEYVSEAIHIVTRKPHGRESGDWVVISGVLENGSASLLCNGSFQITNVTPLSFDFAVPSAPVSPLSGDMFVGRYTGHLTPVHSIAKLVSRNPLTALLESRLPHNRVPGEWIFVWSAGGGVLDSQKTYLGSHQVAEVITPTQLTYRLDSVPDTGLSSGAIVIGFGNQGISADNGSEYLVEGNRIFGMRIGGPYHDTFASKNLTLRNNYYTDVTNGPTLSVGRTSRLKSGASIIHQRQGDVSTAVFHTQQNHHLETGDYVIVRGAIGLLADTFSYAGVSTYGNSYNGKFLVTRLSGTAFSYLINSPLGGRYLLVGGEGGPSYDSLGGLSAAGSPVFEKVSGEKLIKTGSSLIRKTGAATTAVFTTVLPHNLADGQPVKICGARIGNDYPTAFNPSSVSVDPVSGQPAQFEFSLGTGADGDPDASESPVFSAEPGLTGAPSVDTESVVPMAIFTANDDKRTGLFAGQIVKISGVNRSELNGVIRVASVASDGSWFKYRIAAVPTGSPSIAGPASFTVFFDVQSIAVTSLVSLIPDSTGTFALVITTEPHRLQRDDTVSIWGTLVGGSLSNPCNGAFRVELVGEDNQFYIALEYNPHVPDPVTIDSSGAMWATQNSTPIALKKTEQGTTEKYIYEATFTTNQPAATGQLLFPVSSPSERSLVSLFGAVLPNYGASRYNAVLGYGIDSLDNPYNNVVEVLSATRRSFTFRLSRDRLANEPLEIDLGQPQENPRGAPACARVVATPVTIEGNIATYHTVFPHNMYPGRGVQMEDPGRIFQPVNFIEITSTPDRRSFSWQLDHVPAPDEFCRTSYAAIWQSDRLLFENNVIEMGHHVHPDFPGALEDWAMPVNGGIFAPQYTFRGLDIRGNVIRPRPGQVSPLSQALRSIAVQRVLAENNLIDLPNPGAGENDPSASHPVIDSIVERARYMGNQRPDGEAIHAYNITLENNVFHYSRRTELPEELTDTLFFTL